MIQSLEEFKTYQRAMELGEKVHDEVSRWNFFEKDTVGKQLVGLSILLLQIFQRGWEDIIIRKRKTSPSTQEVHCLKQRHGSSKQGIGN